MKPNLPKFILSIGLLITANSPALAQMVASNDRVRVEVSATSETDHKDLKNTTADTVTQNKTLKIALTGKARPSETRVVKWTAFGRSMKGNAIVEIQSGESKLALDPTGKQTIETKAISTTYTPDHTVVTRGNGGRGGNRSISSARAKQVEGEGKKFAGYSVKVLDGKTVVGEASDPVGIGEKKPQE